MLHKDFTATQTAKITFDLKRVRKYDTTVRDSRKGMMQLTMITLVFLVPTALFIWLRIYILAAIPGLVFLICVILFCMLLIKGQSGAKDLRAIYTEGPLIPAIIRKTEPLTILALVSLDNNGSVPARYGCREFKIHALPGHTIRKGERVPCTAIFAMSGDRNYFSYFEPHPICCATADRKEVQWNIDNMDDQQDWDILNRLAEILPDNDCRMLYILDENHEPLISRNYDSNSGAEYRLTQESKKQYQKRYDVLPDIRADHPDMEAFLKLAKDNQVAEYFLGFEGDKDKGYVTPMNNPAAAEKDMAALKVSLASGEVPLATGKTIASNKGIWDKKGFTPWRSVSVRMDVAGESSNRMRTYLGSGKNELACFNLCYDLYPVRPEDVESQIAVLKSLETERLAAFWLSVKNAFAG